ncbi:hypothetical protein JKF63_03423 [Porcisia hertigi]|uniref:PX domain-containing protein n=1 Tax=Porcisia hertigi TaxID=2761500 RepID=A0A836L660_9TRYP|nr:hypothetical protein JKF63_03423 [Porcisia hertigi]
MSVCTAHQLRRSASSVATELWSPHELYSADPQVDVLQPTLTPLEVDTRQFYAFRLSLSLVPFEVLENYWAPQARVYGCPDDGVLDVTCTELPCDGGSHVSTTGTIAEQRKPSTWFRFSSTISQRSFVVDRTAAHVQTLVSALRYSFPHLLFPADLQMSKSTCVVLFNFIVHHWPKLSAYLPLLYFLFELQERAFSTFYKQLATQVQTRKSNDAAACDALKPKKSRNLLSWLSSKPKEVELSVKDRLEIIDAHKSMLPVALEKRYMLALAKQEQMKKMQYFCHEYIDFLKEEMSTYEPLGEGPATFHGTFSSAAHCYPASALKGSADDSAIVKQIEALLQSFALRNRVITKQFLLPHLAEISACASEMCVIASSHVAFYDELMMRAKAVNENTTLLSRMTLIPMSCEASTRPESLANAREVNRRHTIELANCVEQLYAETAHAEAAFKALMKRLCIAFGGVVKSIAFSTDEQNTEVYLHPVALTSADNVTEDSFASHPPQEFNGVKEGRDEAAFYTDRGGS